MKLKSVTPFRLGAWLYMALYFALLLDTIFGLEFFNRNDFEGQTALLVRITAFFVIDFMLRIKVEE